jgi:hypothetical protein
MFAAAMLLVISRERPLFPSQTIIARFQAKYPDSKFVADVSHTYSSTPDLENQRLYIRKNLPPGEPVIGYASIGGISEPALWFPLGQRRVEEVLAGDTSQQLRLSGIHYVVVEDEIFRGTNETLQQWLSQYGGTLVKEWMFLKNPYEPMHHLYLVHLQNP